MLKQRVVTALVLLALLLPALFAPVAWPFALLTLVLISAAGWEWGRLNGLTGAAAVAVGGVVLALCLAAMAAGWTAAPPPGLWWLATLVWVLGGAWALRHGPDGWGRHGPAWRQTVGVLALSLAWLALGRARAEGLNFLLSVFCLVWMADIAAYFGGRTFGRRKLALSISPGKSWEGVWSGMAGVLVLGFAWHALIDGRPGVGRRIRRAAREEDRGHEPHMDHRRAHAADDIVNTEAPSFETLWRCAAPSLRS